MTWNKGFEIIHYIMQEKRIKIEQMRWGLSKIPFVSSLLGSRHFLDASVKIY